MTQTIQNAYIVSAVRSPVGKAPKGMFKHTRPDDLLAHVLRGVMERAPNVDLGLVEDVVVGCAMPEAEQGMNVARIGVLMAGFPDSTPGMTINRFCSSGTQALALAANQIQLGEADFTIAAGTESMSMVPMMGHQVAINNSIFKDENIAIAYGMGITAEKVSERWKVSREDQDAFALTSHQRAIAAIESGAFQDEIKPYDIVERYPDLNTGDIREKTKRADTDEGPRADTSAEVLAKLRTVFRNRGTVTAGNSSQMSDGAGALLLASEAAVNKYNLEPLGRFVGFATAGVEPEVMGIGPIAAVPRLLKQTGVKLQDIDWIELNEAFAAQALAVIKELDLDPEKVNPLGGAIALGHPLGATGAILANKALYGLRRTQGKYGLMTMCIGTGMGAAALIEAL